MHGDHGSVLVEERDRAVLHLAGGIGVGRDVADLLELQRALEAARHAEVAADVEEELLLAGRLRDLLDLHPTAAESSASMRAASSGRRSISALKPGELLCAHRPAQLGEAQGEQDEGHHLARERLRRRHTDLAPGAGVERAVGLAGELRVEHVADRERDGAAVARHALRGHGVGRLAGLRHRDHERLFVDDREAVAELARDVDLDGQARPLLDQEAPDQARMARRAAGGDADPVDAEQHLVADAGLELHAAVAEALADRVAQCGRLLVDLLEHERLVAALLGGLGVPGHEVLVARDLAPLDAEQRGALGRDDHELAVVDVLDAPRLGQERDHVGGQERLAGAEADHERALKPRADDHVGVQRRHHAEGEVAVQVEVGPADGVHQVARVVLLHQVGDDLGISLGCELGSVGRKALLDREVVLDDAVEHDREAPVGAAQGMRVALRRPPVRGPARVPDARCGK